MRKNAIVVGADWDSLIKMDAQLTKNTPTINIAAPMPGDISLNPLVKV